MTCQYYRTEIRVERANAHYPGAKEFAPKRVPTPYCAHAASVAPRGKGRVLSCGGDLAKCLIPDKL